MGCVGERIVSLFACQGIYTATARNEVVSFKACEPVCIGISVEMSGTSGTVTLAGDVDTLTDIDLVIGSDYADVFMGGSGSQQFMPGVGADYVDGGAGDDEVSYWLLPPGAANAGISVTGGSAVPGLSLMAPTPTLWLVSSPSKALRATILSSVGLVTIFFPVGWVMTPLTVVTDETLSGTGTTSLLMMTLLQAWM